MNHEPSANEIAIASDAHKPNLMVVFRIFCLLLILIVYTSDVWRMSRWSESRGVYDDVWYLRQAHLFQRFGIKGIDTDVSLDDDRYLSKKLKEIGFPTWQDVTTTPCARHIPATGKIAMFYPPGTGFLLAAFPAGIQVGLLYITSTAAIFLLAMSSILMARTPAILSVSTLMGFAALYLMNNPAKASYSIAPTLAICAWGGFLTIWLFQAQRRWVRLTLTVAVALLLGFAVNIRLANVLLAAGYLIVFAISFARSRRLEALTQGILFGSAFAIGLAPTLIANTINAGHPLATPYGAVDTALPNLGWDLISGQIVHYFRGTRGVLLTLAIGFTILFYLRSHRLKLNNAGQITLVVAANLAINLFYFLTHHAESLYYSIPISMLSLWTLFFAYFSAASARARPVTRALG